MLRAIEMFLELRSSARDVVENFGLVQVGAARQHRGCDRDANRTPDIAHEVEDAGCITDLLIAQRSVGRRRDGHENERQAEAGNQDGQKQRCGRDAQSDVAEVESRKTEGSEPEGKQPARIHLIR